MTYTLLFGNNFISESPKSVKYDNVILFRLDEDINGPHMSTQLFDFTGDSLIVKVEKNICTYCVRDLVKKKNERIYVLIDNRKGENLIQSRVIDRKTILVSGIFSFKEFMLVATQNYIILPSGKRMMHSRTIARYGSVSITDNGIIPDISG
jgi:hypothetical protein